MAALGAAVALAEVNAVSIAVEENLDLHVAGSLKVALQNQLPVSKCPLSLAPGRRQCFRQLVCSADDAHPLAPAAGRRFDEDR